MFLLRRCLKELPFWFEGNLAWGQITSQEVWRDHIVAEYARSRKREVVTVGASLMRDAHAIAVTEYAEKAKIRFGGNYIRNFGLYTCDEHISPMTLEDWARANGMYELLNI